MRILIKNSLPTWLFIFSTIVFAASLAGDFVMDDWPVIKENSKITDLKYIPDYFTQGVWSNTDLADNTGVVDQSLYRPVFLLTLNIAYQIWGDSSLGYHALNLVLHSINTVLVYFLILGFLSPSQRMIAGMSAAIFAVHPVHVESVAWAAGLTDPLVSIFLLSGFLLHRYSFQENTPKKKLYYSLCSFLCFSLALLSKETAIFFPLIILVYDALFQRRTLLSKSSIIRYLAYAVLLLLYFLLRDNALNVAGSQLPSILTRIDIGNLPVLFEFITYYAKLLIFPSPLAFYYEPPTMGIFSLIVGGLFIAGSLVYLPFAIRRKHALFSLSIVWIAVTLLPVLPIALYDEPIFAQRALYLPAAGFAMLIAWFLQHAQHYSRPIEATAKTIAIIYLFSFSMTSMSKISDWENDTKFYSQAIKTNPNSYKPIAGLATTYEKGPNQNKEAAVDLYLKAAKLATHEIDKIDFWENAARIYGQSGNISKSETLYNDIVRRMPTRSSAWVGLGNNALAKGNRQQALGLYQKAFDADPSNNIASYNLALIYQQLGNFERAAFFQRLSQAQ